MARIPADHSIGGQSGSKSLRRPSYGIDETTATVGDSNAIRSGKIDQSSR